MRPQFLSLVDPLPGTYSGRHTPCHYDPPAPDTGAGNVGRPTMACPFKSTCRRSGHRLDRLERVYGRRIVVTLSETTASILNRADQHFRGGEISRNSLRKHLYSTALLEAPAGLLLCSETLAALSEDKKWPASAEPLLEELLALIANEKSRTLRVPTIDALREKLSAQGNALLAGAAEAVLARLCREVFTCRPFQEQEPLRSYIGFVDNRLAPSVQPIEMALLAPPSRYYGDPSTRIITGRYARLFGQADFASTVFSMCEGQQGGTSCAETCVAMALGMISDQTPVLQGGFDIAFLASRARLDRAIKLPPDPANPKCLHRLPGTERSFSIDGLTPRDIHHLVNNQITGVYGTKPDTMNLGLDDDIVLARMMEACIDANLPMILHVDAGHIQAHHQGKPPPEKPSRLAHAIVLVGCRGDRLALDRFSLIFHDPSFGPYQEIGLRKALAAARAVRHRDSDEPIGCVRWNVCSAKWLSIHPEEVLAWVSRKLASPGQTAPPLASFDFRCTLRSTMDLVDDTLVPAGIPGSPRSSDSELRGHFRSVASGPHCWTVVLRDWKRGEFQKAWYLLFHDGQRLADCRVLTLTKTGPDRFSLANLDRSNRDTVLIPAP